MDREIKELIANLRHAARDRQTAAIGGGLFGPAVCAAAADRLEASAVHVVLRDSADGLEVDVFHDEAKARTWADACGGDLREESTLDDDLPALLASLNQSDQEAL